MKGTITIRIDAETGRMLARVARLSRRTHSEVVREALRRQLSIELFEQLRQRVAPFATRGLCSDVVRLVLAEHDLVVSETILAELGRVLADKIGLPDRAVRAVVRFVRQRATVMPSGSPAPP